MAKRIYKSILTAAFIATLICCGLMLASCGAGGSINKDCQDQIVGDYQITGQDDNYWHLYISPDEDDNLFFTIYDNAAGNPGVEGEVVTLDEATIKIEYDKDLYEALPADGWELDGKYLEMTYAINGDQLTLTNNGVDVIFEREAELKTICTNWNSDSEHVLDEFKIGEKTVSLKGWIYDPTNDDWEEMASKFNIAEDCIYNDGVVEQLIVEKQEFQKLLEGSASKGTVLELDVIGDDVKELRLVKSDESMLVD